MKDKNKKEKTDQPAKESLEKFDSVDNKASAVEVEEVQKPIEEKTSPASEPTFPKQADRETESKGASEESPETMPISLSRRR